MLARGEKFSGYSLNAHNHQVISQLEHPRCIGRDSLLEITLDNGGKVRCTPDHKFSSWDGRMIAAYRLRPNDLLAGFNESGALRPVAADIEYIYRGSFDNFVKTKSTPNVERLLGNSRKVTSVRELAGVHDVYCLTVPQYGNFALQAGVFVANCGIIVNVTPFEPEWEGYVTLEFSNTTPLPAKIYANEGVAQVLFFEADDNDVCEVSYKDRGGKYQGQQGVTIPKL